MSKYLKTKQGSLESAVLEAVSSAQQAAIAIAKKEKEEESVSEEKHAGWIAMFNGKKVEIRKDKDAKDLYTAKQFAIKALNVPKSKQGLLAVEPAYEEFVKEENLDELAKFSDKEIKMAFGVINDPRWKGGNMTKIVQTIEKIKKGLSKHPSVMKAIQSTNEELSAKQKKIDANKNGKIDGDDLAKLRAKKEEVAENMQRYASAIAMWAEASGCKKEKKEEKEDEVKGKTMTGKPLDKIDVNPKDEDK
jgi:hypothetical protein